MSKNSKAYHAIGLMSGSSLDGLDLAYCSFTHGENWSFKLIHSKSAPLKEWENKLRLAIGLDVHELKALSKDFAYFLAQEVKSFIQEFGIQEIDAVVSHGHTIFHNPEHGRTCQIGDGQTLADALGLKVVNNLRQADLDAGGQGAPIVPIGDLYLFEEFRICLNLGGIANLSIKTKKGIFAFDVCTANQVLNHYAQKIGKSYDNEGGLARTGKVNLMLLEMLNGLEFYQLKGPKSLDNAFAKTLIHTIDSMEANLENALASYVEHIADQIQKDIAHYIKEYEISLIPKLQLLVTGGGAFNTFLIEKIQEQLDLNLVIPKEEIVTFKEAIVMAFIGVLRLRNESNVLASVTGANRDTSCGDIFEKA